jgi:hypothetical protein
LEEVPRSVIQHGFGAWFGELQADHDGVKSRPSFVLLDCNSLGGILQGFRLSPPTRIPGAAAWLESRGVGRAYARLFRFK